MLSRRLQRSGWSERRLALALLFLSVGIVATFNAWIDIFEYAWKDQESSQILLVPIVFAWLMWVRRDRLKQIRPRASLLGPVLVVVGWGCYGLG